MDIGFVFLYIAAIVLAIVPVLWTGRLRKTSAADFLVRFRNFVLLSNLTVLANLIIRYLGPKLSVIPADQVVNLSMLFGFILVPALIVMCWLFIRLAFALLRIPVPRPVVASFFFFWGLFFIGFVYAEVRFFRTGSMSATQIFETVFDAGLAVFFLGAIILLLAGAAKLRDPELRFLGRSLALAYVAVLLISLLAPGLSFNRSSGIIIISLFFLSFHVGITAFLAFHLRRIGRPEEGSSREGIRAVVFEKYRITLRERDIVLGILEGLSNADIASARFISKKTVETHIRNIYQKTGVKNRIQLLNLFREDPNAEAAL
jgi:DNA-binding CsgD family transcriptional regulator